MDDNYECTKKEFDASIADQQWFYAKSKVPICLAITECLPFLHDLNDAGFLSEEESLELQADTRSDHRIIYECLCCIEEKNINLKHFFEHLFKKSYLNKYPDLRPILQEYTEDRSGNSTSSTVDMDTDYLIFAQEKVPICLAITDCFPFLHGLQDLTILSETESLKLQADERPVSRVIYECLSVIQKKDMKLNVVFEYIFQQCYLKVYPALQDMLQGPNEDQSRPFNGRQFPVFTRPGDLLDFFEHNKAYICEAIDERFPILHGLHDKGLLSRLQLLKLQADRRLTNEVLYQALCLIDQQDNIEMFFAYVFQEYYLELYPDLNTILQNLNDALKLEIYPPSPVSCSDQVSELQEQESSGPSTDSIRQSDHLEDNTSVLLGSTDEYPDLDYNWMPIRKCRMKPINYTEPPDYDLEHVNGKKRHKEGTMSARGMGYISPTSDFKRKEGQWTQHPDNGSLSQLSSINGRGELPPGPRYHNIGQVTDTYLGGQSLQGSAILDKVVNPPHATVNGWVWPNIGQTDITPFLKDNAIAEWYYKTPRISTPSPEHSLQRRLKKRRSKETKFRTPEDRNCELVTNDLAVKLEFPKQVFSEAFQVRCGNKKGMFLKKYWTGDSRNDKCIRSDGKRFTVIKFEKYGGKESYKNWKRSISCEKIALQTLLRSWVLKPPLPRCKNNARKTM